MNVIDWLVHSAFHEAGHAVAASRLGLDCCDVTVKPGDGFGGRVSWDNCSSSAGPAERALIACSGYAALVVQGAPEEVAILGCEADFASAERLIEIAATGGNVSDYKLQAVRWMTDTVNRQAMERVAEYLLSHETMPGDLVDLAVEVAVGTCSLAEFEETAKRVRAE